MRDHGCVSARVTVFGSCNMDLVAYVGTAPRRGETVLGREFCTVPGGKGANQAIAAALAGAEVRMIGAVGQDQFSEQLRANLRECEVDTAGLRTVAGHSGTAHIVVDDDGGNSIVVVPAANSTVDRLVPGDEELISAAQILLLQLEVPLVGVEEAVAAARRHGVKVVLTPAPVTDIPSTLIAQVDLLVPNQGEAEMLSGESDPKLAMRALLKRVPEVVITLGNQGVLYGNRRGDRYEVPAIPVRPVDTTAAGDTFLGVLATAMGERIPIPDALRRATAAAALSVQRNGASSSMPTRQEISDFFRRTVW